MVVLTRDENRSQNLSSQHNGPWHLRLRSSVIICPDCGAIIPRSAEATCCALCGARDLHR